MNISQAAYSKCVTIILEDMAASGHKHAGIVLNSPYKKINDKIIKAHANELPIEETVNTLIAVYQPTARSVDNA